MQEIIPNYSNTKIDDIMTPVDVKAYATLLWQTNYDPEETKFLVEGFSRSFPIGYQGPVKRKSNSNNIPFTVGDKFEMWRKLMKEVKLGRYTGLFDEIPYEYYIQSPLGLMPKSGNQTRLIFHLSYNFSENLEADGLVNYHTPKELCSVKYNDLDVAVRNCLCVLDRSQLEDSETTDDEDLSKKIFLSKSDLSSAFRQLPVRVSDRCFLIMKACHPISGKTVYLVEKCVPFSASISCSHFQRFSNSLHHIITTVMGKKFSTVNYLDDYLFIEVSKQKCNQLVRKFLEICKRIKFPVSMEKTEWASTKITFLGILLDGDRNLLVVPEDKRLFCYNLLNSVMSKRTVTIKQLEILAGHLNFLGKAIFPARAFTRRMYSKFSGLIDYRNNDKTVKKLKRFHHITVDAEFKLDCGIWSKFLEAPLAVARPWVDLELTLVATELKFFTDASLQQNNGVGYIFNRKWTCAFWESGFIQTYHPSIEYAELLGVCVSIFTWQYELQNLRAVDLHLAT